MKTIHVTENSLWDETLRQAEQEEVLVLREGRAVALLIPFDDDDVDWYIRERDPAFLASLVEARRQVTQGSTVSHADMKSQLGIE